MPLTLSHGTKARLIRERHADHVVDGAQLGRRDDLADFFSTASTSFSVSSSRVPRGARYMQLDEADVGGREEVGADDGGERAA